MADPFFIRLRNHWNAFQDRDRKTNDDDYYDLGPSYAYRIDRPRLNLGNDGSIVSAVYTRIGMDAAAIGLQHVKVDENDTYIEKIDSRLNECLTLRANIDQTAEAFMQDVIISMFDEGSVAIVPVDTTSNPKTGTFDVVTMRTAKIVEWMPAHVRVNLYNERSGQKEDITLPKKMVVIVENPLYSVVNESNSTIKRLINKLNLLDVIDEQSGSGRLDLIFQVPYAIKTATRRKQAEARRTEIESQLKDSKYGIAYTDATEKITQLNRPAENNMMTSIEYLTRMLYSQLGISAAVFEGTADESEMLNYYNRSIEPVLSAIANGMKSNFISKTGRSQGQSIKFYRDPFKLVPAEQIATIADSLTRNEILSSNEVRGILGYKPSKEAGANQLRNKNLNISKNEEQPAQDQNSKTNSSKGVISK